MIRRDADPADGRVVLVELTDTGLEKIDAALPDHATNGTRIVAGLTGDEKATLARLLRQLHNTVEGVGTS